MPAPPPPPPPPPPPGPPPPQAFNAGKASKPANRGALLNEIANPGMRLKKTVTVDKSAPLIGASKSSPAMPSGSRGPGGAAMPTPSSNGPSPSSGGGMGGLFGGGKPMKPSEMRKQREQAAVKPPATNGAPMMPRAAPPRAAAPSSYSGGHQNSVGVRPTLPTSAGQPPRLPPAQAKPTTSMSPPPPAVAPSRNDGIEQQQPSMAEARAAFLNTGSPAVAPGSNPRYGGQRHAQPSVYKPPSFQSNTLRPSSNRSRAPAPPPLQHSYNRAGQYNTMAPAQAHAIRQYMRSNSQEDISNGHSSPAPPCPPHRRESNRPLTKPSAPPPPPPMIQKPSAPPPPPPPAAVQHRNSNAGMPQPPPPVHHGAPTSQRPNGAQQQPQRPAQPMQQQRQPQQQQGGQTMTSDWLSRFVFSPVEQMPRPPKHSGRAKVYSTAPRVNQ